MRLNEFLEGLGRAARIRREALGRSQEAFAADVGLHRTYVGGFERGERNVSLGSLQKIADGLMVPISVLFAEAERHAKDSADPREARPIETDPFADLAPNRHLLLGQMADSLRVEIEVSSNPTSDICTPAFLQSFQDRLVLYHAMNEDVLKKKTFEYAFAAACRADQKTASVIENQVHPGQDVIVDGTSFSLKTEAHAQISPKVIMISKLMEARWIRECRSGDDFLEGVQSRVVPHLNEYERILVLRALKNDASYEYQLVEIPRDLLLTMGELQPEDFSPRTKNGSSGADVRRGQTVVFHLTLDGSVEKVTIRGLLVSECTVHTSWQIPIQFR